MRSEVKDIPLKTSIEVGYIRRSCRLIENTFLALEDFILPGISTRDINDFCAASIGAVSGGKAIKGYRGYPASVCTSVNQVACHGLPNDLPLRIGDLLTVDITAEVDGWFGDSARTFLVGGVGEADAKRLMKAAYAATSAGIKAAKSGNRVGDIGAAVEGVAEKYGCCVLDKFVGHGIGQEIHEEPMVLHTGEPGTGQYLVPGMVLTVEPILTLGENKTKTLEDGWSIVTSDGKLTAQFEHTLAIFGARTENLTLSEGML